MKYGEELMSYTLQEGQARQAQREELARIKEALGDDYQEIIRALRGDGSVDDLTLRQQKLLNDIKSKL